MDDAKETITTSRHWRNARRSALRTLPPATTASPQASAIALQVEYSRCFVKFETLFLDATDAKCGKNEEQMSCGSCDDICGQPPTVCSAVCRPASCGCVEGFLRNRRGTCVPRSECDHLQFDSPIELVCRGDNEIVHSCGACDMKCNEPSVACSLACGEPECGCANGWTATESACRRSPAQPTTLVRTLFALLSTHALMALVLTASSLFSTTNCPVVNIALAPEGCVYAEEINEVGCSTAKLICQDLKCGQNEEVKICGACDPTCEKPICASSLLCKQPECGCIDGFVRDKIGTCINATQCQHHAIIVDHHVPGIPKVAHPKCGLNEELKACGSACAPTCTVPEPVCEAHCIIDVCQCKEGYVAFTNGSCIALSDCPEYHKNVTECGEHEAFTNCGSACEPTCENTEPTVCTLQCVVDVCQCVKGYVRNSHGKCVKKSQCKAPAAVIEANHVCDPNEHFTACGTECEPTCSEPFPAFCTDHCVVDVCQCAPGFVRDTNNKCVLFSECLEVDDSSCGRFEKFQSCGTACEPTCENPEPKDCTQQCILDVCQCRAGYVRDDKGKCIKKSHCPKKEAPKNEERICGTHEKFQTCGTACEPTCENQKPAFCTDHCIVDVCQCEASFVRHVSGLCVSPSQC
ncbi:hypothetical protein L596_004092 [Steinernema carpocapsae]|uniref:EGF-like domain-containing protein n=1 Tax=Steinernema carpocapsae TaxID=34508 RepID=A0A4U8UUL1_STECR|nr:hypothetical protein L596_004092 [Steinernema carpocapsae]